MGVAVGKAKRMDYRKAAFWPYNTDDTLCGFRKNRGVHNLGNIYSKVNNKKSVTNTRTCFESATVLDNLR